MFKKQSFQNFNMMYDAFGSWQAAANRYRLAKADGNEQAMKEARAALSDARHGVYRRGDRQETQKQGRRREAEKQDYQDMQSDILKIQAIYQLYGLNDKQRAYPFEAWAWGKTCGIITKLKSSRN